jgi:hypothetical protein
MEGQNDNMVSLVSQTTFHAFLMFWMRVAFEHPRSLHCPLCMTWTHHCVNNSYTASARRTPRLESLIVGHSLALFEEFRVKCFNPLWQPPEHFDFATDTCGNVFGGFTPVKSENHSGNKGDDSLRSVLFTLTNPNGVSPRKCALRVQKQQCAIKCNSVNCGPFVDTHGHDDGNKNRDSQTRPRNWRSNSTQANDTAFQDFLTVAGKFTVKDVEVFEFAGETELPADVEKNANERLFRETTRNGGWCLRADSPAAQACDSSSEKATRAGGGYS